MEASDEDGLSIANFWDVHPCAEEGLQDKGA